MNNKVYIVYGVSGSGKTTVGIALAESLGLPFYDADDYHPQSNKRKMEMGEALNDADRAPWLTTLSELITTWNNKDGAVLACSALKEVYRKKLESGSKVNWVHLKGTKALIEERLKLRKGHFFNSKLLDSQFQTLELANYGLSVDINNDIDSMISEIKTSEFFNHKSNHSTIGLVGLGVMGKSLSINWAKRGVSLSVYNRHVPNKEEGIAAHFIQEQPNDFQLLGFDDLKQFINSLETPRKIVLMINAGKPIDDFIREITPFLSPEDILIDGGNSNFKDTERRSSQLAKNNLSFIGVGISGGEEGAKNGPSIMPGGAKKAYEAIQPYLEMIAAKDQNSAPCCTFIGPGGSGHFVKTMHNGIEYAEMQIIAETYAFLRVQCDYSLHQIEELFKKWSKEGLSSYLLNITIEILKKKDDLSQGQLLDKILDVANQKGTGGWSTNAALALGTPLNTIAEAVMARNLSAQKPLRIEAATHYNFISKIDVENIEVENILKNAYQVARIINHAIGFEALQSASQEYNWALNLSEIARIWTNGCIIKSELMEEISGIFKAHPQKHLLLTPTVIAIIKSSHKEMSSLVSLAVSSGAHIPVIATALNYLNGFSTSQSSANLIQAQRDFFGAHTYKRNDKPYSEIFHTDWINSN